MNIVEAVDKIVKSDPAIINQILQGYLSNNPNLVNNLDPSI